MLESVRPHYAKEFRCIGSDCEDTCCHGLDVVIDKPAYEKLQSLPGFQPRLNEHFVVLANHSTDSQYARIKLTPSCTCPFLSVDRMCGIQQEHGEYYLPDICASYPRVTQRIDGWSETALLLSCPEAARLVLLNPTLLPPDEGNLPRYLRFSRTAGPEAKANGSPHQYLWDIRGFALLLLQDRAYPLWQRLFMLGMFCKRLNEITAAQQLGLVPQLLTEYAEMITHGSLRSAMDGIPVRSALQLGVVLDVVNRQLAMTDASHIRFRDCVQDFLDGIHYEAASPIEGCTPFFEEAYARYYRPFMQQRPYILENYLVNHVSRTRLPYGVDAQGKLNDPLTEYFVMCVLYAVIKGLLIGMAGHYREAFAEAHVIKLIQSFAKAVEHSPKFLVASDLSLANADGMALLLKNNDGTVS
jgi:lysine-N-methylase